MKAAVVQGGITLEPETKTDYNFLQVADRRGLVFRRGMGTTLLHDDGSKTIEFVMINIDEESSTGEQKPRTYQVLTDRPPGMCGRILPGPKACIYREGHDGECSPDPPRWYLEFLKEARSTS